MRLNFAITNPVYCIDIKEFVEHCIVFPRLVPTKTSMERNLQVKGRKEGKRK